MTTAVADVSALVQVVGAAPLPPWSWIVGVVAAALNQASSVQAAEVAAAPMPSRAAPAKRELDDGGALALLALGLRGGGGGGAGHEVLLGGRVPGFGTSPRPAHGLAEVAVIRERKGHRHVHPFSPRCLHPACPGCRFLSPWADPTYPTSLTSLVSVPGRGAAARRPGGPPYHFLGATQDGRPPTTAGCRGARCRTYARSRWVLQTAVVLTRRAAARRRHPGTPPPIRPVRARGKPRPPPRRPGPRGAVRSSSKTRSFLDRPAAGRRR